MRIGFVSFWFTRGQAFVTREIKRVYEEAGHQTFVLARPDKLVGRVRTDGVWSDGNLRVASRWEIPKAELLTWAAEHQLDVAFFFQNEQFDEVRALRQAGVRTVGTFMWELLSRESAKRIPESFDCIYALHAAQIAHFSRVGILAHRVHWGCWPELAGCEREVGSDRQPLTFYYPAGYLEARRPTTFTVKAFLRAQLPNARLLVKSVKPIAPRERVEHPSVTYLAGDLERREYLELLRSCDVVLANTRWEGLGLVFYEAIALGLPIVCPDFPPMSENVRHGLTGLLVTCRTHRKAPSGIPAAEARRRPLVQAIRRIGDRSVLRAMSRNTLRMRDLDYNWERTRGDLLRLLDHVGGLGAK